MNASLHGAAARSAAPQFIPAYPTSDPDAPQWYQSPSGRVGVISKSAAGVYHWRVGLQKGSTLFLETAREEVLAAIARVEWAAKPRRRHEHHEAPAFAA